MICLCKIWSHWSSVLISSSCTVLSDRCVPYREEMSRFLNVLRSWLLMVSVIAMGNTVQSFRDHSFLSEKLYTGTPEFGERAWQHEMCHHILHSNEHRVSDFKCSGVDMKYTHVCIVELDRKCTWNFVSTVILLRQQSSSFDISIYSKQIYTLISIHQSPRQWISSYSLAIKWSPSKNTCDVQMAK